jgi:hypothetical protein
MFTDSEQNGVLFQRKHNFVHKLLGMGDTEDTKEGQKLMAIVLYLISDAGSNEKDGTYKQYAFL